MGLASRWHESEQVSLGLPFSDDVDSIINLEVVSDSKHEFTLLAFYLSLNLRNGGASDFGVVLIGRYLFYDDLNA